MQGVAAFLGRALSTFGGIWGSPASSGYAGGRLNRLTSDWVMLPLSADQELKWNLRAVRARARELVRDNPFAKRFIQLHATNVIGPDGIRLQGNVAKLTGEPHTPWNETIETEWARWGRPGNCTADGRWSWREVERLIAKSLPQDGEVLIRLVKYFPGNDYAFAIQLLDPDQLDHLYNRQKGPGENEIRMGVEIDEWSRPVAYHVFSAHPSEYEFDRSRERERILAADIIHLYVSHRISQTRGISWFHPVLMSLKLYDGYQEAELVSARVSAASSFYITSDGTSYQAPEDTSNTQEEFTVEPGVGKRLAPGEKLESWTPEHPTTAFEAFTKQIMKSVATGLGVTHANLSGDLSEANYSSLRAGFLPERDEWSALQDFFIDHCHQRIYEAWLSMAILSGRIKPGMRDPEGLRVNWEPRGWDWIDPFNDMKANVTAIEYGLTSRTRIIQQTGENPDEIFAELEQEQKIINAKGLAVAPVTVQATKPGSIAPAPNEQQTQEDAKTKAHGNGTSRLAAILAERGRS
jgi:lambda family phage portal protein